MQGQNPVYNVFVLILSIYAVLSLALITLLPVPPEAVRVLEAADFLVCILFFCDFLITLWKSETKLRYLYTWGWLDLISSIPMVDLLRFGRVARIIRIIRVFRGLRATKVLSEFILKKRAESTFLAASLISILLIFVSSVAILQFEKSETANIKTAEDAIWWSVVTITTVGYGDKYPISTEGRIIAALLMTAGVGLFGIFTGFVASWFLKEPSSN